MQPHSQTRSYTIPLVKDIFPLCSFQNAKKSYVEEYYIFFMLLWEINCTIIRLHMLLPQLMLWMAILVLNKLIKTTILGLFGLKNCIFWDKGEKSCLKIEKFFDLSFMDVYDILYEVSFVFLFNLKNYVSI